MNGMTEEDTFLKLRKLPFLDMVEVWWQSPIPGQPIYELLSAARKYDNDFVRPDICEFFAQYGWNYIDFIVEVNNDIKRRRHGML